MQPGAFAWLTLWERAASVSPPRRRRALLASPGLSPEIPAERLGVGQANALLLRLHGSLFGPRLSCQTKCPGCGAALEIDLDIDQLLSRESGQLQTPMLVQAGEWQARFRLPTEGDVDAVREAAAGGDALLQRCVVECRRGAEPLDITAAPPELRASIGAAMEDSDPLATLDFELSCASCGHEWPSALEVHEFVWARLDAWARRTLQDVHTLARAYGWSERAILEMSPYKRQVYLDMVAP